MQLKDIQFELPEDLIAKFPVSPRDSSRLLVVDRATQTTSHHHFFDLPQFLEAQDLLVLNNTKVLPARLFGKSEVAAIEILLLKPCSSSFDEWECLIRPGKKAKHGLTVSFEDGSTARVEPQGDKTFRISFQRDLPNGILGWLSAVGAPPLPPYLKRQAEPSDKLSYQTVYAEHLGSVAAPTAGLHFTERLLTELKQQGVQTATLTLHVGYGTFSPIRSENVLEHSIHFEDYEIPQATLESIKRTRSLGGRVFAVGTTSLRTLESFPRFGMRGSTNLYITPGYSFQMVDGLVTNFHLPGSSLYVLVCSLLGVDFCRAVYEEAIAEKYRFYSYGDAMLIL